MSQGIGGGLWKTFRPIFQFSGKRWLEIGVVKIRFQEIGVRSVWVLRLGSPQRIRLSTRSRERLSVPRKFSSTSGCFRYSQMGFAHIHTECGFRNLWLSRPTGVQAE